MMTIEHEQLPPERVDDHGNGWAAIAVQMGDALGTVGPPSRRGWVRAGLRGGGAGPRWPQTGSRGR